MKNSFKIVCLALMTFAFSSCLKDDIALDPDKSTNVIEFKNPSSFISPQGSKYALYTQAFELAPEKDYPITVSYSGAQVAPTDITVNIGIDTAAVTQYNKEQEEHFDVIPASLYTLPTTVVIPKGQRTATLNIKIKSEKFDFTKHYVLPVQIKSASSGIISGNFGTILLGLNAKNKYDGNYTVTATAPMLDNTSALLTGYYPLDANLETTGPTSVVMFSITYVNGNGHPIKSTNATTGAVTNSSYGNFAPVFTMDDTGKVISVTNFFGQGTNANGRHARLNPAGVNKFTINADGSKTMEVSYVLQQAGPVDRTFFYEKWTFKGAR